MNTDDKLRAILRTEADVVDPSPAGYDAIRRGIEARSRRRWLFRSTALAGAALTLAGTVFVLNRDDDSRSIVQPPATSSSPSPNPTPTSVSGSASATPPVLTDHPIGAIWPLTTEAEVRAWEADRATYPSLASVSGSALGFARGYLDVADASVASSDVRDGSFFFEVRRPGNVVVTTLELRAFGEGGTAPYLVVAARSDAVAIDVPAAGSAVSSPLAAHGTYHDVDVSFTVRLRADDGGSRPVELAEAHATVGPPNDWDATLTFTTTARTGSILVTNGSLKDSGISSAAAYPVTFA